MLSLVNFSCFNRVKMFNIVCMNCISLMYVSFVPADGISPSGHIIRTDRQTDRRTYFAQWQVELFTFSENIRQSKCN